MSELTRAGDGDDRTDVSPIEEVYVRRINWLVTIGRSDLIDEIADDCERRVPRGQQVATAEVDDDTDLPRTTREPQAGCRGHAAARHQRQPLYPTDPAIAQPPGPVETGTRLAVARLRCARRPAFRTM